MEFVYCVQEEEFKINIGKEWNKKETKREKEQRIERKTNKQKKIG